MIGPTGAVRVMVATKPVDFRKGTEGLAALVREAMGADPFCGAVYVFRAKRADRVKLIFWDGTGMVLFAKRLEDGEFRWPGVQDAIMRLTRGGAVGVARRARLAAGPRAARDCRADGDELTCGGVNQSQAARRLMIHALVSVQADALPDDPGTLKAMLIAERMRERAAAPDHQGAAAPSLRPAGRDAARRSAAARAGRGRAGRGAGEAETEQKSPAERKARAARRRTNRGALPAHLPRIEMVVDIEDHCLPVLRGDAAPDRRGRRERLDIVPAQFRVLVVRRPKYACRACEDVVVQAPAPARLIEGGLPTEATVAQVLVSKYADHLPLYRQAQIYARQGIDLDRSTLADWVGRAALLLRPVHERLLDKLKASTKLFADETTAPVLDPGRGRTKTGQLWAYARDDRPWGGTDPPGVAYVYAPDRKAERPIAHLAGFTGILQVDGYGGYRVLAEQGDVQLAFCWCHVRRTFYELAAAGPAPIASEALERIAELYAIESRDPRPHRRRAPRRPPGRAAGRSSMLSNPGCAPSSR